MNFVHIVCAFGAGVIFTILAFGVFNVFKPGRVDKIEGDIRSSADRFRK